MNYRDRQQGVALAIALIALVAISLAGVALMRTVDTSNVVSGNIAFNESASQVADIGAEKAFNLVTSHLYTQSKAYNAGYPDNCLSNVTSCPTTLTGNVYFYANVSPIDPVSKLPYNKTTGAILSMSDPMNVSLPGDTTASYTVQYLIERMCTGTANTTVVASFTSCNATPLYDTTGTASTISTNPANSRGKLFYRITVLVNGPRNTHDQAQYFYGVDDAVVQ